jgi:energy-converting hydrogenase Eha subunit E
MQYVLFTILGIALYLVSDWVVKALERRAGHVFEHRTLMFFAILLALALVTFAAVQRLAPMP